jgi:capsular polysaccharide biosynthesis protein
MTNFFDNKDLLNTLWKWKKHLIVVGMLSVLLSAFFSSAIFIKPKYKSTARVYPSKNLYVFSDESESEQLLEIISAQDIKLRLIDAFDLSSVYKISKKEPMYLSYMMAEFNDNISFKKTEYETIEISVLDTDPKRAAAMCDSIIVFLDEKVLSMHRIKYIESAIITKKEMDMIMLQVDSVKTRMDFIRKEYGIFEYTQQSKEITEGMVDMLVKQKIDSKEGRRLEKWMKDFAEYGGEFELLAKQQIILTTQLEALKKLYDEAVSGSTKKIIYGQLVQSPIPADKKSYPIRGMIVLISTLAALFTAMLVILVLDKKKA